MSDYASCASERSALRAAPTLARGGVWGVQSAAIGSRAQTNGSESLRLVVAALAAARSSLRSACEDLDCRTGSHSVGSGGLLLPATCLARCPELSSASSSPPNRGRLSGSRRSRGLHPLAPGRSSARGAHRSLRALASEHLAARGWGIASPLQAQALFRQTLQARQQPADAFGMAQRWQPAVRALLRSGLSPDTSLEGLSARSAELARAAQAYQARLRERSTVDPGEAYWRAAELAPPRQAICFYGYFQPEWDELAWMEALAADGSLLLPASDAPLWSEGRTLMPWLTQRGWQIRTEAAAPQTPGERLSQAFLRPETAAAAG